MRNRFTVVPAILTLASSILAQDPGWPRQATLDGVKLLYYQPQVDSWKDYNQLDGRMAVSITPARGKAVVGVIAIQAQTDVEIATHTVLLSNLQITNTYFPSLDSAAASQMRQLITAFLPALGDQEISLDRLVASVTKSKTSPTVSGINNSPPAILVSYGPAIVLSVYGQSVKTAIDKTDLETLSIAIGQYFSTSPNPGTTFSTVRGGSQQVT
jgi:hypothetical protein